MKQIITVLLFVFSLFVSACSVEPISETLPIKKVFDIRGLPTPLPESTPEIADDAVAIDITLALPVGDPERGEELLTTQACIGCHLIGQIGTGPSWKAKNYAGNKGIAQRAEERWQHATYTGTATSATEYLFESIVAPNAYVIDGYYNGIMPLTYGEIFDEQDIADLIAFLLQIE